MRLLCFYVATASYPGSFIPRQYSACTRSCYDAAIHRGTVLAETSLLSRRWGLTELFLEDTLKRGEARLMAFRFAMALIASVTCGFAQRPTLIAPEPCEGLVVKPLVDAEPWHGVFFENRTDTTLHVFRISSDGRNKYPSIVLEPRHAVRRGAKSGAVWVVEDESGKCLAAYRARDSN